MQPARRAKHLVVLASLITLLGGCGVADLDYTDKICSAEDPCPDGWGCVGGRCVRGASGSNCKIQPANFRVAWKTPNSIRWAWDPDRNLEPPTLFGRYELRFGPGAAPAGEPQLWTAEQNAELGQYRLNHTGADDHVAGTVTDGLQEDTTYWAQLVAYDNAGCAFTTAVVSAKTAAEPAMGREIVLFDNDLPPGSWTDPREVQLVTDQDLAYRGTSYLAYDPVCADPDCGNVPKLSGLDVPISMIDQDIDKTAFLELAVASAGTSDWAGALLALGPADTDGATFEPYTLTEGTDYRLWQIPLSSITKADGNGIGTEDVGRSVYTVGVIGNWEEGKQLRIDEVRIRW